MFHYFPCSGGQWPDRRSTGDQTDSADKNVQSVDSNQINQNQLIKFLRYAEPLVRQACAINNRSLAVQRYEQVTNTSYII